MSESDKERQILTSTNKIYKRYKGTDGKQHYNVYNRHTGKRERNITHAQAHREFRFIKMNQTIKKIQDNEGLNQKQARDKYFVKQAEILEGRIKNIMSRENMNRNQAEMHYKHLIDTKQYNKLKKYS